jgi:hypothetical protein
MKVNQLAVPVNKNVKKWKESLITLPRVVLPGIALGSSQKDTQLIATRRELGM